MTAEAESATERWHYAGVRVLAGRKKGHAWVTPAGKELYYGAKNNSGGIIGAGYDAEVSRAQGPKGTVTTLHGTPRFAVPAAPGDDRVADWAAQDKAAKAELELETLKRNAKRIDPLDEALAPLLALARKVPAPQRDAFAVYVLRRINGAW